MIHLYRHQRLALAYLQLFDNFALFMEPGTGKTLVCLHRILELFKGGNAANCLVVGPKSALGAWRRDIEKFYPEDAKRLSEGITLVNYERVWRKTHASEYTKPWDILILDEAHAIKNRTSKQAEYLLRLSLKAKYRYILTGTPISNGKLEDIYSQLTFLDPYENRGRVYSNVFKHLGRGSYYDFTDRYCYLNQYWKPYAYKHVAELQAIIGEHSYTVKKADCLELPPQMEEIIDVELPKQAKDLYKRLATSSALVEYDILAENPLTRLLRLRQLASGYIYTPDGKKAVNGEKKAVLKEVIERYPETEKLAIFAEFKASIADIKSVLDSLKISYVVLDGEQKNKDIWRHFQTDPQIRAIVCQYKSANAGIDLYASSTMIYYEPTIKSDIFRQSMDRIHRNGQTKPCSYVHLLTKGTVEVNIYQALKRYEDFNEKLFTEYIDSFKKSRL